MKSKNKKGLIVLMLIILFGVWLVYYILWRHPVKINSGIFKLEKNISAHDNEIWAVKYAHAGKFFATGSVDSTVKIWTAEGKLIRVLKHPEGVTGIDINANDSLLVTSSYDGKLRIWDISTGILIRTIKEQEATVWTVAWSPVSNMIAAAGEDKNIKIIDAGTGQISKVLSGHTLNVWCIKFTPDGTRIITGSFDRTIRVWNTLTGAQEKLIIGHTEAVVDIAVSNDGKIFASGSDDKSIKLWQVSDGSLISTLEGGEEHVQALCFSHDGTMLLSGGRDKDMPGEFLQNIFGDSKINKGVSMRVWDLRSGKVIQTFSEHANDVNDLCFSNDDRQIVTASSDRTVEIWVKK